MGLKTFKYRLYPSLAQEQQLFRVLNVCRHFYNMCLEERKLTYQLEGRSVKKADQEKLAVRYRKTFPQAQIVFSQTLQTVADTVDKAFQAFFRRVKNGEKPGYPRFKNRDRFHSFAFKQYGVGARLDGRRLKLFGIGRVPVRWHRPLEGTIKTVRIVCQAGQWYACFACQVGDKPELPKTGRYIALDVGVTVLLTTSEGEKVENPKHYRAGQRKLRRIQRKYARQHKGSQQKQETKRRLQRFHQHVANQRQDYIHKLTYRLVQTCDGVALEDLAIPNMVHNHHLSKSILDSGWGLFKQLLTYKAEDAGREVVLVNPAYTSKCCSKCGAEFQNFDLSTRWVECACGLNLDRDHNAALNILKRAGWDAPVQQNVGDCAERAVEATRIYP